MKKVVSDNWRKIDGYLYDYQINDLGQLRKIQPNGKIIMMKPHVNKGNGNYAISLKVSKNKRKHIAVKRLMDEVFFDGYARKHGLSITNKNGIKTDCSVYNLEFITPSNLGKRYNNACKRVAKVTRDGDIVAYYASCEEAARKNFVSKTAVYHRVHNMLKNPWCLDGCTYQFVEDLS